MFSFMHKHGVLKKSNFEKFPAVRIEGHTCTTGWDSIRKLLSAEIDGIGKEKVVIAIECYHGIYTNEIIENVKDIYGTAAVINAAAALLPQEQIDKMVYPYVTDDPVFGYITSLTLG
jgi:hypothetical protein